MSSLAAWWGAGGTQTGTFPADFHGGLSRGVALEPKWLRNCVLNRETYLAVLARLQNSMTY
eukprot:5072936-Heterocapsa_arctica.AAC.1